MAVTRVRAELSRGGASLGVTVGSVRSATRFYVSEVDVVFKGNDIAFTNALGTLGHLDGISVEATEGLRRAHVRLRDGVRPGQLLHALGEAVEVCEFVKIRPTMESLFIQAVEHTAAETAAL